MTWLLLALVACSKDDEESDIPVDTDTGEVQAWAMTSGTVPACSARGGNIAWQKFTYTLGTPEATLIFVNGRTEYTDKYHHLLEQLEGRPWNVVMYDHYGQGRSDGIRAHADDFEAELVCDFGTIVDTQADPGLPILVLAHSTGSLIAARYAELEPDKVDAYVLGSPMFRHDWGTYTEAEALSAIGLNLAAGKAEEPYADAAPRPECDAPENDVTHDCELYEQFYQDPITTIGPPTWGWLYASVVAQDAFADNLATMAKPVLLFQAGDERVVNEDAMTATCEALNAQEAGWCELVAWPGDMHELFNEVDRAAIVDRAEAFFEARLAE